MFFQLSVAFTNVSKIFTELHARDQRLSIQLHNRTATFGWKEVRGGQNHRHSTEETDKSVRRFFTCFEKETFIDNDSCDALFILKLSQLPSPALVRLVFWIRSTSSHL